MRATPLALALALALLGSGATAQLGGFETWTFSGDPSGWASVLEEEMTITGPAWDNCTTSETYAYMTTVAELSGRVDAHIVFDNQDGGFGSWTAEDPVFLVDGEVTYIGPGDFFSLWEGDVSFHVDAGQSFGFGVQSIDCSWGPGITTVNGFSFTPDTWQELGHALAGTFGEPKLDGIGVLLPGSPWELGLVDTLPTTTAFLVIGTELLEAPFKGGVLVPDPLQAVALVTSPAGRIILTGTWPVGVPSGTTLVTQYWIDDPAGPAGWAATNAVMALVP